MGTDKALLVKNGQTQLARTVELLNRHVPRVFISTRVDQTADEERSKFEQIVDSHADLGPVAGILSAMEAHPDVNWLVVACDLPNVDDATISTLLSARDAAGDSLLAYRSVNDGLPEPLCSIYPSSFGPRMHRFIAEGVKCPRKMMIRADATLLEQPHAAALANVNAPQDLAGTGARISSHE